jgi:hypothetical protein
MCGQAKPEFAKKEAVENVYQPKNGDWKCSSCGDYQFAKNVKCRKCDTPKTQDSKVETVKSFIKATRQEDICADTNDNNNNNNDDDDSLVTKCSVCLENDKNTALIHENNTAHMATCYDCAKLLKDTNSKCPICRQTIISINVIYIS